MERRFDDDQVADILRRAADLQAESGSASERGTTLAELKRVGVEVGFDPESIERAAQEMERKGVDLRAENTGGSTQFEQTAPGAVDDEAWEDILTELRRTSGRTGKSVTRGITREWIGGSDSATITLSARKRGDGTRLRLLLNFGSLGIFPGVMGLPFGVVATVATAALMHKAGFQPGSFVLGGLGAGAAIVLIVHLVVARWMGFTRRRVSESFQRIVERASMQTEATVEDRPLRLASGELIGPGTFVAE